MSAQIDAAGSLVYLLASVHYLFGVGKNGEKVLWIARGLWVRYHFILFMFVFISPKRSPILGDTKTFQLQQFTLERNMAGV